MSNEHVNPAFQPALARAAKPAAEPQDWANILAAEIIVDAFKWRYTSAESLIAARLRLVRAEGEAIGLEVASGLISKIPAPKSYTARDAAVIREHQADHSDERAHGWA